MRSFFGIVIGLFLLFTLLFVAADSLGYADGLFFRNHLEQLRQDSGSAWCVGAVISLLLAADLFLPVPSSILMTLSGFFLGTAAGAFMAFVGAMGSAVLGFGMCRRWGRKAFVRWVGSDESRVRSFVDRYGTWAILLSRPVPMLTEVVSCVAGMSAMPFRQFLALSVAGTLPICLVYAWAGAQSADSTGVSWAVLLAFVIPAVGFAVVKLAGARRHQR